jgi:hypothetical protein
MVGPHAHENPTEIATIQSDFTARLMLELPLSTIQFVARINDEVKHSFHRVDSW